MQYNFSLKHLSMNVSEIAGGATWLGEEEGNVCDGGHHFLLHLLAEQRGVPVPLRKYLIV